MKRACKMFTSKEMRISTCLVPQRIGTSYTAFENQLLYVWKFDIPESQCLLTLIIGEIMVVFEREFRQ